MERGSVAGRSATAGGCYQVCREGTNDTIGLRGGSGHGLWILGRAYKGDAFG